jgi:hypothetical protein
MMKPVLRLVSPGGAGQVAAYPTRFNLLAVAGDIKVPNASSHSFRLLGTRAFLATGRYQSRAASAPSSRLCLAAERSFPVVAWASVMISSSAANSSSRSSVSMNDVRLSSLLNASAYSRPILASRDAPARRHLRTARP